MINNENATAISTLIHIHTREFVIALNYMITQEDVSKPPSKQIHFDIEMVDCVVFNDVFRSSGTWS